MCNFFLWIPFQALRADGGRSRALCELRTGVQLIRAGHAKNALQSKQFLTMLCHQVVQYRVACARQMHLDRAPIGTPGLAFHQSQFLAPRDQRNHTVMMGLKAFGQFADRSPFTARKAADMQQQLILKMGDAAQSRRLFAETQETPELVAEMGKRFEILFAEAG